LEIIVGNERINVNYNVTEHSKENQIKKTLTFVVIQVTGDENEERQM